MNPQAKAKLVPCKNCGDHQGHPPSLQSPRQKSPAFAKFASSSWSETPRPDQTQTRAAAKATQQKPAKILRPIAVT
ncbi:MAG: hypothetical protein ACOYNG_03325, partial [Terrimicrobiaceae bacterium]